MATVRFSDQLNKDIKDNARRLHNAAIDKVRMSFITDGIAKEIHEILYTKEQRTTMDKLGNDFFSARNTLSLAGFYDSNNRDVKLDFGTDVVGNTTFNYCNSSITPRIDFSDLKFGSNARPFGMEASYGTFKLSSDRKWDSIRERYITWCKQLYTAEVKRDEFVAGVQQVINSFSTLAPALKAWPPLWDLVPDDKQRKHKEIVERSKSTTKDDLGIDTSKLTAAVTMAKLTR
tara:strand:+ start:9211 stop:9906 length:696 start_codon:yes stop_codon:yes gene_type:complete